MVLSGVYADCVAILKSQTVTTLMNINDLACITLSNKTPSTANLKDMALSRASLTLLSCSSSLAMFIADWIASVVVLEKFS